MLNNQQIRCPLGPSNDLFMRFFPLSLPLPLAGLGAAVVDAGCTDRYFLLVDRTAKAINGNSHWFWKGWWPGLIDMQNLDH